MEPVNPLHLPEILGYMARYLSRNDQVQCLRVCKSWQETIEPLVWNELFISKGPLVRVPAPDILQIHRHQVTLLNIDLNVSPLYMSEYPKLHTLSINMDFEEDMDVMDLERNAMDLVHCNPSLVCLKIRDLRPSIGASFWSPISQLLPRLRSIVLHFGSMSGKETIEAFWSACTTLESLEVVTLRFEKDGAENGGEEGDNSNDDDDVAMSEEEYFGGVVSSPTMIFPRLCTLQLYGVVGMDEVEQLSLFSQCPQLQCLTWHWKPQCESTTAGWVGEQLVRRIGSRAAWPHLRRVNLYPQDAMLQDQDLSQLMNGMEPANELCFPGSGFGPVAFQALRRHFDQLQELTLSDGRLVTSPMLQEILCSCPSLTILRGESLQAKDIVQGTPWVCLQLKTLLIGFVFEEDEDHLQPRVFACLSRLSRLEFLHIGCKERRHVVHQDSLDCRLQSGLGSLIDLRVLAHFSISGTRQALSPTEVEWMVAHWTCLEVVYGNLSTDTSTNVKLRKLLQASLRNKSSR
ncbi:MAG: hypothetical protein J3Q66DRAFT_335977 [Benniella sp.]|nr:MAG: hypothetical protein J3Q66DRAFT_335977 [Benniella sp.]